MYRHNSICMYASMHHAGIYYNSLPCEVSLTFLRNKDTADYYQEEKEEEENLE